MYMLDTNICIYIIKKKPVSVFEKFEQLPIGSVAMSLVTYGELQYGALRSNNSEKALNVLEELANYIPVLPAGLDVAKHYAEIRADLTSKGTPIGNNDLWIAAHAQSLGHTLVSNNVKEFERVENLILENWV
ncbi:type II toxin-antitoxin system VapC family toxin [Thiomicrorhabdus sp.]|uniref:type II toxin-antitoxin system tRNA(fMet)-specific endonuclease VapC n=1 Tax=Thiomicrorhabdus sp. TaxID=2039724 RepID=UPI0029C8B9D4|nr:type II toxin-antitoxin system VapC family toxin [Thiomicrorhabdus sp.]